MKNYDEDLEWRSSFFDHLDNLICNAQDEYDREMIPNKLFANWDGSALLITEDGETISGDVEYMDDSQSYWFNSDKVSAPVEEL